MKKPYIKILSITLYIFFFLVNCFMFYFLGNYFNLLFVTAMVIIPIATFFFCRFLSNQVSVSITGASLVEKRNDEFVFHIDINNRGFFFTNNCVIYVDIHNSFFDETTTHSINIPINPFSKNSVSYPVKSRHCGVITIKINDIYIYDLLNMFSLKKKVNVTREIPIFPDYTIIDDNFSMDFSKGYTNLEESTSKGHDSSEVSDVREYIPGDKLQNIHWKLSAKKDILMVKEHVSLTSSQLVLYVELALLEENLLDLILDYTYGIGIKLCNENVPFTYIWYSTRKKECISHTVLSRTQLNDAIFEMLYETPFDDYEYIRNNITRMTGYENFITIGADYVLEKKQEQK